MSAERLREAAKVLRGRAEAATPGPWGTERYFWRIDSPYQSNGMWHAVAAQGEDVGGQVAAARGDDEEARATVAYIATVDPAVGLALADWLTLAADLVVAKLLTDESAETRAALAVADAILGGAR